MTIFEKKVENEVEPLSRSQDWQREKRNKTKKRKRHNWCSKDGSMASIFVPAIPMGELAKELREIVEKEKIEGITFRVVEMGGRTVKSQLQRLKPTKLKGCANWTNIPEIYPKLKSSVFWMN